MKWWEKWNPIVAKWKILESSAELKKLMLKRCNENLSLTEHCIDPYYSGCWKSEPPTITTNDTPITFYKDLNNTIIVAPKIKVKKQDGYWWVISPCGNFKEQYSSWNQVLRRLGEIK